MTPSAQRVTQLLIEWGNGNHAALEELMPVVYGELHKMARRYMNQQNPPHTLQTTALINEAYLRLAGDSAKKWQNRAHFFGVAARAMRHILVDHARTRHAAKRGGAEPHRGGQTDEAGQRAPFTTRFTNSGSSESQWRVGLYSTTL